MDSLTVTKSSESPREEESRKAEIMSAADAAAVSLFDALCPRLEALLDAARSAAEQTELRLRLVEQRSMVSSYSTSLHVHTAVYEMWNSGVCKTFSGPIEITRSGGSGPLFAKQSARVTLHLGSLESPEYRLENGELLCTRPWGVWSSSSSFLLAVPRRPYRARCRAEAHPRPGSPSGRPPRACRL